MTPHTDRPTIPRVMVDENTSLVEHDGKLADQREESLMNYTVRQIRKYLVDHRLEPGDRIPTERKLAELFGVSRTVVRDAIKTLSAFGIVDVRDRVGIFVANAGSDSLGQRLSSQLYINKEALESLLEVRHTLERSTAEWAAERCTDIDRERLREIISRNRACISDPDSVQKFRRVDNELHMTIAHIARNPIVLDLLRGVFKYLRSFGVFVEGVHDFVENCTGQHEAIVDAIGRNDPVAAREAMIAHLASVHAHLLEQPQKT